MQISDPFMISSRTLFAIVHARGAAWHTRRAQRIEDENPPIVELPEEIRIDHQSAVIAAVILSVAFLEALANELFLACVHETRSERIASLTLEQRARVAALWMAEMERSTRSLEKFNVFLTCTDRQPLARGTPPFQDASSVVALRNTLVHAQVETVTLLSEFPDVHVTEQQIQKRIRGRFRENPFTGTLNAFFPDRVLSAGCAQWAFSSCIAIGDAVYERLQVPPPYHHIRSSFP